MNASRKQLICFRTFLKSKLVSTYLSQLSARFDWYPARGEVVQINNTAHYYVATHLHETQHSSSRSLKGSNIHMLGMVPSSLSILTASSPLSTQYFVLSFSSLQCSKLAAYASLPNPPQPTGASKKWRSNIVEDLN